MMDEPAKKRVDESWKEQAEREKRAAPSPAGPKGAGPVEAAAGATPTPAPKAEAESEELQARFDVFLSGLAMEALVALGDMAHPATRKQAANLPHAKYLIDLLGLLEEKTKGNLSADEEKLLTDALYQLRMRYLAKSGG
jgi:hypothetical protein